MALTIPNTNRVRSSTDSTVADSLRETQQYINRNVTQAAGNKRSTPKAGSRPVLPVAK